MSQEVLVERLFEALVNGDRPEARGIVEETLRDGVPASRLISDLLWPTHELVEKLFKTDRLTMVSYHFATRLMRQLSDQAAARLEHADRNGKTVFAVSGPSQGEELAGQMACDMLEAGGFEVSFTGGSIPADEILSQVQERQPSFLLMFSSAASDLPEIRRIVDTMREIGACPHTQVVVGGGVFNRAEGLAEEIGIDLSAESPLECVELLCDEAISKRLAARQTGKKKAAQSRRAAA